MKRWLKLWHCFRDKPEILQTKFVNKFFDMLCPLVVFNKMFCFRIGNKRSFVAEKEVGRNSKDRFNVENLEITRRKFGLIRKSGEHKTYTQFLFQLNRFSLSQWISFFLSLPFIFFFQMWNQFRRDGFSFLTASCPFLDIDKKKT